MQKKKKKLKNSKNLKIKKINKQIVKLVFPNNWILIGVTACLSISDFRENSKRINSFYVVLIDATQWKET